MLQYLDYVGGVIQYRNTWLGTELVLTYTVMQMHIYSTDKTVSCVTWSIRPHIFTEDKQALRQIEYFCHPTPHTTQHCLINPALTPAYKNRRAHREGRAHRLRHIYQPTPT